MHAAYRPALAVPPAVTGCVCFVRELWHNFTHLNVMGKRSNEIGGKDLSMCLQVLHRRGAAGSASASTDTIHFKVTFSFREHTRAHAITWVSSVA